MASAYPGALDTFTDMGATLNGPPTHSDVHDLVHDALVAIQAELGTDPAGAFATVKARCADAETRLTALDGGSTTRRWIHLSRGASQSLSAGNNDITWTVENADPLAGISVPITTVTVGATLGAGMYRIKAYLPGLASGETVKFVCSTWGTENLQAGANTDVYEITVPLGASETVKITVHSNAGGTVNSGCRFVAYRLGA